MRYSDHSLALQEIPGTGLLVTPWQKQMVDLAMSGAKRITFMGADTPYFTLKLYDHELNGYEGRWSKSYYSYREVWFPGQAYCSCGWKSGGDDVLRRAEVHIAKLRAWLDEHPEEEVMAGLGGQVNWPPKPKRHKNKAWNKKKRR